MRRKGSATSIREFDRVPALVLDRLRNLLIRHAIAMIAVAIPATLLSFAIMVRLGRAGIDATAAPDYQVYRWAVRTWLSGGDIMATAPMTSIGHPLPWVYPPFALLPLTPLALLPLPLGLYLLYAVDLLTIGTVLAMVTRRLWPSGGVRGAVAVASALLPWCLFLEPIYSSVGLGQVNIVLMGLVVVDCLTERPRWSRGLLVGLATAIKLTPAAFLLFFLARRDFRAAGVTLATAIAGTLLGFVLDAKAAIDYWFQAGPANGVSGSAFHTNQSIMGELVRLGLSPVLRNGIWVVLCVAGVLVVVRAVHRADPPLALVGNGLVALLVSPTSWSDHWVWVAPALLLMFGYALRLRSPGWLVIGLWTTVTAVVAAFRKVPDGPPWTLAQHLTGNPYLLLGLALMGLLWWHTRQRVPAERAQPPESDPPTLVAASR